MLHLPCRRLTPRNVRKVLARCKELGIKNILALRGDAPPSVPPASPRSVLSPRSLPKGSPDSALSAGHPTDDVPLSYAVDLVRLIRSLHGDDFCIGVAGYPDGHPDDTDMEAGLRNVAAKVEAGANFVLTQAVYRPERYKAFVEALRSRGIDVPVIPGIMPVYDPHTFDKIVKYTQSDVPDALQTAVDDERKRLVASDGSGSSESTAYFRWCVKYVSDVCREVRRVVLDGRCFSVLRVLDHPSYFF